MPTDPSYHRTKRALSFLGPSSQTTLSRMFKTISNTKLHRSYSDLTLFDHILYEILGAMPPGVSCSVSFRGPLPLTALRKLFNSTPAICLHHCFPIPSLSLFFRLVRITQAPRIMKFENQRHMLFKFVYSLLPDFAVCSPILDSAVGFPV